MKFEVKSSGKMINNEANLASLYKPFRDSEIIGGKWERGVQVTLITVHGVSLPSGGRYLKGIA